MSTASLIAAMPAAICAISRASGPRTAATMQNSVAPVLAVCLAASTSDGMSSHAERTGEVEQAGLRAEVAVLGAAAGLQRDDALDLDLGAAPAHPHLVGEREQLVERGAVVGQPQHLEHLRLVEADAPLEHLRPGGGRGWRPRSWSHRWSSRRSWSHRESSHPSSSQPGSLPPAAECGGEPAAGGGQEAGRVESPAPGGQRPEQWHAGARGRSREVALAPPGPGRRARRRRRHRRRSGRGCAAPRR